MFTVGQSIKIIDTIDTPSCREFWGIPIELVGLTGVVITNDRRNYNDVPCFHLEISSSGVYLGTRWYFPRPDAICPDDKRSYASLYEVIITNRWNPMNYVSPFKPLKLP